MNYFIESTSNWKVLCVSLLQSNLNDSGATSIDVLPYPETISEVQTFKDSGSLDHGQIDWAIGRIESPKTEPSSFDCRLKSPFVGCLMIHNFSEASRYPNVCQGSQYLSNVGDFVGTPFVHRRLKYLKAVIEVKVWKGNSPINPGAIWAGLEIHQNPSPRETR